MAKLDHGSTPLVLTAPEGAGSGKRKLALSTETVKTVRSADVVMVMTGDCSRPSSGTVTTGCSGCCCC
jgi:hypothetical protein